MLDSKGYYRKMGLALPSGMEKILGDFINEKFIRKDDAGRYEITNMGALLISKDLSMFEELSHKVVRVIWYKGTNRLNTVREKVFNCGYAIAYNEIVDYIMTIIPQEEVIEDYIRKSKLGYPEIAIRGYLQMSLFIRQLTRRVQVQW